MCIDSDRQTSLISPFTSLGAIFLMYFKTTSRNEYSASSGPTSFFWREKYKTVTSFTLAACLLFTKSGTCVKLRGPQQSVLTISACAHVQYWMYCVLCSLFPLLVLCSTLVSRFRTKKLPSYLNLSYKPSNKSMSNLFNKSTSDCLKL